MSSNNRYIHEPTLTYPIKESQIRAKFPNTSFAKPFSPPQDYVIVVPTEQPSHDTFLQTVTESQPIQIDGVWMQQWTVRSATTDEMLARQAVLQESITAATQERLDTFARTRNYDGILSACTYASSTILKFQIEGQYCVEARDATWAKLYQIMAEVEAGTRPMPSGYANIEDELPELVWPE